MAIDTSSQALPRKFFREKGATHPIEKRTIHPPILKRIKDSKSSSELLHPAFVKRQNSPYKNSHCCFEKDALIFFVESVFETVGVRVLHIESVTMLHLCDWKKVIAKVVHFVNIQTKVQLRELLATDWVSYCLIVQALEPFHFSMFSP